MPPVGGGGFDVSRIWTDERYRGVVFQILLVLALAAFFAFIVLNTIANLQRANLSSGYDFLFDTAAFDINQRLVDYASTSTYGRGAGRRCAQHDPRRRSRRRRRDDHRLRHGAFCGFRTTS